MGVSAGHVLVRPFVVMAARALGPGPARLRLVRLAHNLSPSHLVLEEQPAAGEPAQRAA